MWDNETLEAAALRLEQRAGNEVYVKAWKVAARVVRDMKKLTVVDAKSTDKQEQISLR